MIPNTTAEEPMEPWVLFGFVLSVSIDYLKTELILAGYEVRHLYS